MEKKISLLATKPFALTPLGRVVTWLNTKGRLLLIFTELIVILAFFSRFWLDKTNIELGEQLREKRAILASVQEFENEFRALQDRLKKAGDFLKTQTSPMLTLELLARVLPNDVVLLQLEERWSQGKIDVTTKLVVFSEQSLSVLIRRLLAEPKVSSLTIGKVSQSKFASGLELNLSFVINPQQNEATHSAH